MCPFIAQFCILNTVKTNKEQFAKYQTFSFCSAESLAPDLHELLKKNGLSVESLEKAVLMQVVTMEVVMVMMMRSVLVCADDCDIFLLVSVK